MVELTTIDEVISALGGRAGIAELARVVPTQVSNWKRDGRIASNTYALMIAALHQRGATAPPSLWGMKEAESPGLGRRIEISARP